MLISYLNYSGIYPVRTRELLVSLVLVVLRLI